ncbi:hypothetical protein E2562_010896 [Oryza meyeriana var. granulata]|uniref:Wax synthase domain-containing protein n=1 Tax=Oryza meyeriana var. granulata TaxID=110450 RepID=A0A6G1BUL6_9ORYZ|nr:hypothetical protein E2562_010896 [Oryza meyeriana var. granulata]
MAALLAAIVSLYRHKERMNKYALLILYSLHVYLALELVLAFMAAAAARTVMGMDLEPQFDRPYLSASLREFWGRRWNLSVPALLRLCFSRPVRERVGGGVAARVLAAFLVSGLMHEAMIYYATLRPRSSRCRGCARLNLKATPSKSISSLKGIYMSFDTNTSIP